MIVGLRAAITTTTARTAASTRFLSASPTNSLWLQLPRRRHSSSSVFRSNQSCCAATIGRKNINSDPPLVVRHCTINSSYYPSPLLSTQQQQQPTTRSRRTIMSTTSSAGGVEYLCGTYMYIYTANALLFFASRCCVLPTNFCSKQQKTIDYGSSLRCSSLGVRCSSFSPSCCDYLLST